MRSFIIWTFSASLILVYPILFGFSFKDFLVAKNSLGARVKLGFFKPAMFLLGSMSFIAQYKLVRRLILRDPLMKIKR